MLRLSGVWLLLGAVEWHQSIDPDGFALHCPCPIGHGAIAGCAASGGGELGAGVRTAQLLVWS